MKTIYLLIAIPMLSFGQWVERNVSSPSFLEFVYFLDDSTGYCGNSGITYKSSDGGWNWQPATGDYANFQKACFLDSLNGFAISYTELFQTSDGGSSWTSISDSVEITEFYHLEERNGNIILNGRNLAQGYFWYFTPDSGQSWEMRNQHLYHSSKISFVLDENHFYLITADPNNYYNFKLMSSDDGGISWDWDSSKVINMTPHHTLTSVYFLTPDTGFIGMTSDAFQGSEGEIFYTYDRFQTIHAPDHTAPDYTYKHGIFFIKGKGKTICAGGLNGHLYCSPDSGKHWFTQQVNAQGYFESLFDAYFWSEDRIVITGYSGRVLLTDSGIHHSLQTESLFNTENIAIFPNPTSGIFTIETPSIPGNEWTMTLTNSAGQTLIKKSMKQTQSTVDASHLPKGVYFIRLQCDKGVVSKRVILN